MADLIAATLQIMGLTDIAQQRDGQQHPPDSSDDKRNLGGRLGGQTERAQQDEQDADGEGNTASDVAQRISVGGYAVHPLVGCDIHQHRIIKDVAGAVTQSGQNKQHQIGNPAAGKGKQQQTDDTHGKKGRENLFFHSSVVRKRSQKRREYRQNEHRNRSGKSPDARCGRFGNALLGKRAEIDGDGG